MIKKLFLESNFLFFLRKQNFSLVVALVLFFILTIAGCESKIEDLIGMGTSEESVVDEETDAVVESTNVEKKFSKIEEKTLLLEDPEIEKTILKKDELRVGLLLPLSGSDSFLGNALLKSAQMALFDNKNDEIEAFDAPCFFNDADTGITEHEHRGRGIPKIAALKTEDIPDFSPK